MGKAIPDRWLNYQPIGQRVPSTRFIAFKVPLNRNINNTIDEELRLAPHSLLESVPNLGLIVDLTNTNRYYNPQAFKDKNVEHQKLMIPGHHTPSRDLAQRFCDYVTEFLEANADNDKLIGVHCTHGVNRTGYLICYFMITKMNMPPKLAIQTFADARGHNIERENYTSSLLQLMQINRERHDSDKSQPEPKKRKIIDEHQWPRQHYRKKDDQRDERRESRWGQDPKSWQQQQQQQHHQRYNQDRNQGHNPRNQHRYQHRQDNETERQEFYNRKDNYNGSYNQRQENWRTRQPQFVDHQSYSRNNNYNNYNNYSYNNSSGYNYSRNNNYGNPN